MKITRLLAVIIIALQISSVAQAGNIIRTQVHVIKSSEAPASAGSAAGSFYRIYISANNGNSYAQMVEVELLDSNGVDYFDQYTVTTNQSSYYATNYKADKLIDNSDGHKKWTSDGMQVAGSWVTFKLPVDINPKTLVIWNFSGTSESDRQPKDFSLQKSSDNGSTWVTVKSFTGQTSWLANEKRYFSLE